MPDDKPPIAPEPPDPNDCCGNGCTPCILDLHAEAVHQYRRALAAWQQRHPDERGLAQNRATGTPPA